MSYGGDEKSYIERTNDLLFENFYFHDANQYSFRWGAILLSSIFYTIFESNPLTFFLASSFSIIFGFIILTKSHEHLLKFDKKILYFLLFFFLWLLNPQIIKSTYNVVTESQGILALSLSIFYFYKIIVKKNKNKLNIFLLCFALFYLYGVKEVYLFLVLPITIITLKNLNNKLRLIFILFGLFFFIFESYLIWNATDYKYMTRLNYFFSEKNVLITSPYYLTEAHSYKFGGILERWTNIGTISKLYIPTSILIALYNLINKNTEKEIYYLSIILCTYIFIITFFFKDFKPLIAYVPVRIENLNIILPLSTILIMNFFVNINNKKNYIAFLILIFSFFLRPVNYINKILLPDIKKTDHNILNVYSKFNKLDDFYFNTGCVEFAGEYSKRMFGAFSKYKTYKINDKGLRGNYIIDNLPQCKNNKKIKVYKISKVK
jgi:hypothetical protein